MSNIDRKLTDEALSIFNEQGEKLSKYLFESVVIHITQRDLDEADMIEGFAEITSVGYDLEEIQAYQRKKWELIVRESGLEDLKKMSIYQILVLTIPEIEDKFTLDTFLSTDKNGETLASPDYHKRMVYGTASKLCLCKKNITFNNAIKRVLQKEKNGTPAYCQKIGNEEMLSALIKELKAFVSFVKEHESEIILEIVK